MVKIVVFDSGLGSISIIKAIRKICKAEIIYFADQKNFPYGQKSKRQLEIIIKKTIILLEKTFSPDLIVMASNTPSLITEIQGRKIIRIKPPIDLAVHISKTKNVAVLGTRATVKSKSLSNYLKSFKFSKEITIVKIDSSKLVDLVEKNKNITDEDYSKKLINKILSPIFSKNFIDVATLSSTHLSLLYPLLKSEFPEIKFLDPANIVAKQICKKIENNQTAKNSIKIFTSGRVDNFVKKLSKIQIKNKVNYLSI